MDITLHKIGRRDRKIPISKLVREPGKIGQTASQNQCDVTKIGSATVHLNRALELRPARGSTLVTANIRLGWK